jgi:hypothetical protein
VSETYSTARWREGRERKRAARPEHPSLHYYVLQILRARATEAAVSTRLNTIMLFGARCPPDCGSTTRQRERNECDNEQWRPPRLTHNPKNRIIYTHEVHFLLGKMSSRGKTVVARTVPTSFASISPQSAHASHFDAPSPNTNLTGRAATPTPSNAV